METGSQELKKEALELIISLYLNSNRHEEIEFLRKNFYSTNELA